MSGPDVGRRAEAGQTQEFIVRAARPEDEPAIEQMFSECFGTPRSRAQWRWRWFGAAGGHGEALVLETDGRPVGHWASATTDMWVEKRRKRVMLGGESMVLPPHRGRGGMGMLIEAGRRIADAHADVWIGFSTDEAARVTVDNGGGRVIGRVPTWIIWPKRVPRLPAPIGVLAARLLAGWRAIAFGVLPCAAVEPVAAVSSAEVDDLAASAAAYAVCMRIRDSAYVRWRWLERPEGHVTMLGARTGSGRLSGYAVLGVENDGRQRIGRVLDLLASDKASLRGLLRRSLADLTAEGCEVVTCDYLDPRPWTRSVLRLAGFTRRPGKIMTAICTSADVGPAPELLESWYLTRGDTDVS
jgi:GNAT superfamily N-acetyltransferase